MTPPEWVGAALLAFCVVSFAAGFLRAVARDFDLDRVVARHVIELAEARGTYEAEYRGVRLRMDRMLDGRWVIGRYTDSRDSTAICTDEQAVDEIVRWRRGAW